MQRRTAMVTSVTAIVVGCAAAVAVPLVLSTRPPGGAAPVSTFGAGAPTRLAADSPPRSAAAPPSRPAAAPAPVSPAAVRISGIGVSAPVVAVGVDARGEMAIPERVDTVGWYRFGPAPGARAGSIVLVGHVDSAEQGEGAFFRLRSVQLGAVVTVTGHDRQILRYRVVGRQEYPKTTVPLDALFTRAGAPHLTLITCGGSFDPVARSYRDNVVVTAVPIGARS